MKLRDKILYMSFGAMLVVLGMILNSLVSGDADAQTPTYFRSITCHDITIVDKNGKHRGYFGLPRGGKDVILHIYGDDGKTTVAHLGKNANDGEMMFLLQSKSKTDKREVSMGIDENGGRFDGFNKMGENVVRLAVGSSGGGGVDFRDKFGYVK